MLIYHFRQYLISFTSSFLKNLNFLRRNVEEGLPSAKWPLILALSHKLLPYLQSTNTCSARASLYYNNETK